jgi:ABC-2 type transport system ATP-binding protein
VFVFVLIVTAGVALARNHQLYGGVLPVAGQASAAPANQTVANNITISSEVISLGSTLQANGQVSTASGPLANASVALHIGDLTVAHAQTDQKGEYAFAVPVGAYYFPAAFSNGAVIYTVVEPRDSSFISTPSAATNLPVDLLPLIIIVVLVIGAIGLGLYWYTRRLKATSAARAGKPLKRSEESVVALYARRLKAKASTWSERPMVAEEKSAEKTLRVTSPQQAYESIGPPLTTPPLAAELTEEASPLESEPERETPQRSVKGVAVGQSAMKAEHLTKKFGDLTIVDDLNLEIKHGEVFGFLGPNGAGKTTSIKMMTGLLQPTSGRVLFNGAELVSMQKRKIGICPQELVLWEALTCRENLTFMGKMYGVEKRVLENRVDELLDYLSLTDKADQAASKLSGGMKRRLNIALSVVHHPEIVFLDEPSAGLDPQTRQLLWDFIRALRDKEGKTVILTTHVMEEADALSDRVAIIDHGKLLLLDTPDALKKTMGKGDVVELQLEDIAMNNAIVQRVSTLDGIEEAYELKDRVAVRALNAPSKLPELIGVIEGVGGSVCDVTIRGNTLEDVFIYLTGRALRE